jgi:phosphatidylglycerophosphate synthase
MPRTALILPPTAVSYRPIAGLPLIRRTALAAQRAGFSRVVALGGNDTERLRTVLSADPRTSSIPVFAAPSSETASGQAVALVPSDCLITTEALRHVAEAELDGRPLLFRAGTGACGILLARDAHDDACDARSVPLEEGLCLPLTDARSFADAERRLCASLRQATFRTDGPIARFDRTLSLGLSRMLVRTPLRPNHITAIGTAIGLAGAWFLSRGVYAAGLAGTLLFWLAVIIDGSDGEVARLKFQESPAGHLFDVATDNVVHVAVFAGLGLGQMRRSPDSSLGWLVALLLGGFACAGLATYVCLLRTPPGAGLPRDGRRGRLLRGFESVMNRDFAYLLLFLAWIDRLAWFLWGAAFGTWIYGIGLFSAYAWRDGK